jgi:hypothetical protein
MNRKEQIAYILGSIIVLYGAFAGRNFSNSSDVLEGVLMVAVFIGLYLVLRYMNRRILSGFEPYKIDE